MHELEGKNFPRSIDINPTAKCNLDCSFCWGPEHTIEDGLSTAQWKGVIDLFSRRGTNAIVFTGGEPLIRPDIGKLVVYAKEQGMRTTLSTNTLLLASRGRPLLPYIDEIGIPLDGSTKDKNQKMRIGNPRHFSTVLNSLGFVKSEFPNIEVTVRTVVSKVNSEDIIEIGNLLAQRREQFDRWKIYQFTPLSIGARNATEHTINIDSFNAVFNQVKNAHPDLNPVSFPYEQQPGRYVFVGPQGSLYGIGGDGSEHVIVGNVLSAVSDTIEEQVTRILDPNRNNMHAQGS